MERLIIRADASTQIGTGHLMRCLALAQAWKDAGGEVTFITACQGDGLLQRLREEGVDIYLLARPYPDLGDWDYTKDVMAAHPNAWVVLDGYHFDEAYQQQVKESRHRLLVIDDMAHLKHYYADIVLNQNLHAEQLHYPCEPYTQLLLGTRYVLLRREFLAWRGWKREIPEVARRVLVTLGGGDPENHTLKVIQALQQVNIPGLEATVVIGASNPHADVLEAEIKESRIPIRLVCDARNMPELMAQADVAVSVAGTTIWELLFFGTPSLVLILADNQCYGAEQIESESAGKNLGWAKNLSAESLAKEITLLLKDFDLRAEMGENARQIVNGQGAQRVITVMQETVPHRLRLRPVTIEDCRLLWEWANDPDVRAAAFSSDPIPWEEHFRWFTKKLNEPHCLYFIALDNQDIPVGQVRLDAQGEETEIDISVDRQRRGHGYGSSLLKVAAEKIFSTTLVKAIHAYVKPQNEASLRAFIKAGFQDLGLEVTRGYQAIHLVRVKNNG